MAEKPIVLKVLLRQRHLQGHTAFCKEYDKVAKRVDQELTGSWPSKAQFYRWLSGDLRGLPYAHHCRILESMFPDWKAEQLFQAHSGGIEFVPEPPPKLAQATIKVSTPPVEGPADISAVYTTRSEFMHQMPPHQLFDGAHKISMVGLSLNLFCQQYSDRAVVEILESGGTVECLFLDPHGEFIKLREKEESHPDGVLSTLTTLNMQALQRLQARLSPEAHARLKIRTYDEVVRFNITIVDDITCVVQPYLPDARGVESPTLVLEKRDERGGLFDTFTQVFTSMWTRAQEVAE
ncbi:hypothetical protein GCM10029964_110070 [Kibdelosporangium lantanae]